MPGNPLAITLPAVGVSTGPNYANEVNAALQALITDVEAKVTPDELAINADLSMAYVGTSYGLTDVDRVELFEKETAPTSGTVTGSLFRLGDELYFQDGDGTNVAITSGGSVAAAAGNIATTGSPAYAAGTNVVEWSGGDLEYRFLDDGTNGHAGLVFLDAQFRNGANSMTMSSLVTTDYSVIWPAVAPTANLIQQVDASGNVTFTNTIAALITASLGLTCAVNQDVTVSGTGEYKHGSEVLQLGGTDWVGEAEEAWDGAGLCTNANFLQHNALTIPLRQGDQITNINVYASQSVAGTLSLSLYTIDDTGAKSAAIQTDTGTGTGTNSLSLTGLTETLANGTTYLLTVSSDSATAQVTTGNTYITYDRP